MNQTDLLELVQPSDGWYAVVGIKDKTDVRQQLVATREELDALTKKYVQAQRNVFFGVARYATANGRKHENVQALKSFWLDIDCGPSKAEINEKTGRPDGYIDQTTGLQALQKFCKTIGLPRPTLVDSGRGIHAYWPLIETIPPAEWKPIADRLNALCGIHKFYVDGAVFETSRVLRVPGTLNFKDTPPKPVEVMSFSEPVAVQTMRDLLGVTEAMAAPKPKRRLTALGMSLLGDTQSSFTKIILRSAKGNGCAQLLSCFEERETLAEGRWFNALSIAKFCGDRDKAIHKLSSDHPDYDFNAVEQKIQHIAGPHSCTEFEKNNRGGCEGCPFQGKITSPISLGKELIKTTEADNTVVVEPDEDAPDTEVAVTHKIPEYPEPFSRGKSGGIYFISGDDEDEPVQIYEHDLYVVKRMRDPDLGDVVVMKLHLPKDGVKEFVLTNVQISDKSELRKALSYQGIMVADKKFTLLVMYLHAVIREFQFNRKAEMMRTQFGWADADSKFIIGDREISVDGVLHSPPSGATEELATYMEPAGSLEAWKEVFKLYERKDQEPHAFAALTGFGSPLFKFLGYSGCMLNVIHPTSGTGKSTILYMCNSIWGNPRELCAVVKDTTNSKMHQLGVMNNLPYTLDEITNTKPAEFSDLAYSMSQGRGKNRMNGSSNSLRKNHTKWALMALCSSNASFYEKLSSLKDSPDGEFMRLIEYKIDAIDSSTISPEEAKAMFDQQLYHNYGWAGEIYAEYLVNNLEEVKEFVLRIQTKIDRDLKLTGRERFWSAAVACNIAGGWIAKKLGLIDWDMAKIYKWACGMINEIRLDVEAPVTDNGSVIGDFINRHMQNILVVEKQCDKRSKMPKIPRMEPKGELLIRYEPDTRKLYIRSNIFKKDCVESQVNYKGVMDALKRKGIFLGAKPVRLSTGTKIPVGTVHCLEFDCDNEDFMDINGMVAAEEEAQA